MKYYTRVDGVETEFRFERQGRELVAHTPEGTHRLDLSMVGDGTAFSLLVDGESHDLIIERVDGAAVVQFRGERVRVDVMDERERAAQAVRGAQDSGAQQVFAVMPGVVVEILVAVGDEVAAGQTLAILEAMKMQNPLHAESAGVVARVLVAAGEAVAGGALLIEIE